MTDELRVPPTFDPRKARAARDTFARMETAFDAVSGVLLVVAERDLKGGARAAQEAGVAVLRDLFAAAMKGLNTVVGPEEKSAAERAGQ